MHKINFDFQIKKDSSGTFIEGYANPATQDRAKEILDAKGWKIENYKKNPIILFDHGLDPAFGTLPIGKAVVVETRDDGLYAKVQISNSKTEKINAIRDLIDEGILKSFSVGFKPGESTNEGDVKRIKSQELLEISVVPIPMHQDSGFSLSTKTLSDKSSKLAKKWLKRYQDELQKKAIETSKQELACDKLELVALSVEKLGYDSLEKATKFLKMYGYTVDNFLENDNVFIFHQKNIKEDIKTFEISLAPYIKATVKGEKMLENDKPKTDEEKLKEEEAKACAAKDKEKVKSEDPDVKAMGSMITQSLIFDNTKFTEEEAAKWAEDHGYSKDKVDATGESFRLRQKDPGEFEPDSFRIMEFKPGIQAVLGKLKEPVKPSEEKSNVDISVKAEVPAAPIPTGATAMPDASNPLLDLQKQTNILLGALISEFQLMNKQMEKLVTPPKEDYEEPMQSNPNPAVAPVAPDESLQKSIDAIRKNQEDLGRRLKKFA
jgi:HK97 family phage prohead protease